MVIKIQIQSCKLAVILLKNGVPKVRSVLRTGLTLCQSVIGFLNWAGAREVFLSILDCYGRIKIFDPYW